MNLTNDIVVIVPTYNNGGTVAAVLDVVLAQGFVVIVVNDGSTDCTADVLCGYGGKVELVAYTKNRGKGYALMQGFGKAVELGAKYAITIDSDGQHSANEIERFVVAIESYSGSMVVGVRSLDADNMPVGNSFANRFSNFWFTLQTGIRLADTQSGFRLYPLEYVGGMTLFTTRYESELELMVRLAWRGVHFVAVPISVLYQIDRVTHFRPAIDFIRISLLNTVLTVLALVYGYPRKMLRFLGL